ncbi:MAG: hypothetical protein PHC61_03110 [Chitinivibrionales bacterium]|nr:hypothetical protein [Chitinivibrionales bacterium]
MPQSAPQLKTVEKTPPKAPFIPRADSVISADQLHAWVACNPLLDSLTLFYQDSFKTKSPEKLLKYQQDFSLAQEKICELKELPGGYEEYLWILKNMGNPKNKRLCDSLHIGTN